MSSAKVTFLSSGAQTATAQGSGQAVANLSELAVVCDVTVASGTMSVWLQTSADDGTTWSDLPFELALVSDPTSETPSTAATTNTRNILESINATATAMAKYTKFGSLVRAAWYIAGSGATFTLSIKAVGKT